jgi:hypothetical protein
MPLCEPPPAVDDEQLLYAKVLRTGVAIGAAVLLVTFALYVTGLVPPSVPVSELPKYWDLSAHEYLRATNAQFLHRPEVVTGWGWLAVLDKGDYLCLIGIALLSAVTIGCYLAVAPSLLRKRDFAYAGMVLAECIVLVLAASGVLDVAH